MPEIKVKHVVSFSSEDRNYPAENLLKAEGTSKWKSSGPGDKSVSVTLQLEKASQIYQIDIGNESSAFVEVLVSRSSNTDGDFQVLLVASSFMNPMESRSGTNPHRVRLFSADKMSKAVQGEKWDRIKVICTQPFNKSVAYGLSFIKLHSPPAEGDTEKKPEGKIGMFKVKDDEGDNIKTGSLFANRGKGEPAPLTGAAAVRAASRLAEDSRPPAPSFTKKNSQSSENKPEKVEKKKESEKKEESTQKEAKEKTQPLKRKHSEEESTSKPAAKAVIKTPLRKQATSTSSMASVSSTKSNQPPLKRSKTESAASAQPFHKLMSKVVFVLSGFQNPSRGQLRDKAIEMGAQYKGDWDKRCTHLVCAFSNTPKYNQVKGKGKIVTKEWISDCYKQKKLLPWRKYRLGSAGSPSESSSEEDEIPTPKKRPASPKEAKNGTKKRKTPSPEPVKKKPKAVDYGSSTDVDTDDEIRRVTESENKEKKKAASKDDKSDKKDAELYDASTDESSGNEDEGLPDLPDFFADKYFFLYGNFAADERRIIVRYITAFDGAVEEYMGDNINYVITKSEWDDNFDTALSDNPKLAFVKPTWIYACNEKQKLIPHQKFVVVPS